MRKCKHAHAYQWWVWERRLTRRSYWTLLIVKSAVRQAPKKDSGDA
jgi:hypothetical protein